MVLNQWVSPFIDGHNPKLCPGGQPLIAFGGGGTPDAPPTVRVVNWQTGEELMSHVGRAAHWLTDTIVTWIEEVGRDRHRRWEFDTVTRTSRATDDDTALVAANEFTAGNGHWASYFDRGRRVVVDGRILPGSGTFRGVSIGGNELLTVVNDSFLQLFDLDSLAPTRSIQPASPMFNLRRNCHGLVFHGYWGDTFVASPTQTTAVPMTITPWRAEGVAVATNGTGGRVWVATATGIASSTKEERLGVLVRPFGETRCLAVWDVEMDTLDLAWVGSRLVLAGASTRGQLRVLELDHTIPLPPLAWPTTPGRPIGRPLAWGAYYEVTSRPDYQLGGKLPSANCTFIPSTEIAKAEAEGWNIILYGDDLTQLTNPDKLVAFCELDESGDPDEVDRRCRAMRAAWTKKYPTRRVPPVINYIQPKQIDAMAGRFPQEPDIFAPQFYFDLAPSGPPRVDFFMWMAWWMKRLPTDRLWMPTIQTFDRNFVWAHGDMMVLANQMGQIISLAQAYDFIIGYGCFSVNRPGGIHKYPELREALRRVALMGGINTFPSRWPYKEPSSPKPDPKPDPKPKPEPNMPNAGELIRAIPRDMTVRAAKMMDEYLKANPRLNAPDGLIPDGISDATPIEQVLDRSIAYLLGQWAGFVIQLGPLPGDFNGWVARCDAALSETYKVIEREQDPQ